MTLGKRELSRIERRLTTTLTDACKTTEAPGQRLLKMAIEIESPCISVCQLSGDLCVSCGRSKDDIRKWKRMKRPEKMAAVQRANVRLKGLKKAHG